MIHLQPTKNAETIADYLHENGKQWQTKETAKYSLATIVAEKRQRPMTSIAARDTKIIELIQNCIYDFYGKKFEEYDLKSRKRAFCEPRQCFVYYVKKHTILTLEQISGLFKNRGKCNHTSVMHNINTWQSIADTEKSRNKLGQTIDNIVNDLSVVGFAKYTVEEILKAAEIGEVNLIDARYICSLLEEAKQLMA